MRRVGCFTSKLILESNDGDLGVLGTSSHTPGTAPVPLHPSGASTSHSRACVDGSAALDELLLVSDLPGAFPARS